jgi:hypothetical protein
MPNKVTAVTVEEIKEETRCRGSTLFAHRKSADEIYIEDFKLIKMLGKSTLGKIMMVTHRYTNETYIMKSIRKDDLL